ncbi:MAG: response regulator [Pseudomonadota bacterium]
MEYDEVKILIVDDDEVCIMALKRAIKKMKLMNPVRVACDGYEALEILRGEGGKEKLESPYIILLDINMPRMDGHEFMEAIRDDPHLNRSIVLILTTSDAPDDVKRAYDKNVAGYVVKEDPYTSFKATFELIDSFSNLIVFPK